MPSFRPTHDLDMHYEVDDFTDPWTHPETVLMLHGNAESGLAWWRWVPKLSPHYRVVRPDMRGFGQSSPMPREFGRLFQRAGFGSDQTQDKRPEIVKCLQGRGAGRRQPIRGAGRPSGRCGRRGALGCSLPAPRRRLALPPIQKAPTGRGVSCRTGTRPRSA